MTPWFAFLALIVIVLIIRIIEGGLVIGADRWIYRNDYPLSWAWFKYLPAYLARIVKHLWQRMTRGFSDFDMWNGNMFLAEMISGTAYWHFAHSMRSFCGVDREEWLDDLLVIVDGFDARDEGGFLAVPDVAWDLLKEHFYGLWD